LCNSEHIDSTKDFRTALPEVKAFRQEENIKSSPPVQNPYDGESTKIIPKKCTCRDRRPTPNEYVCGCCGGEL
jgi:hypothetical protein